VDFNLPQAQATLQIGDIVKVSAPGIISGPAEARIIARDAWVDTRSRNVRFRAIAGSEEGHLSPGLSVTVNVVIGERQTAVQVPAMAVRYDLEGPHVFMLQPVTGAERGTDRAVRRSVITGPERDGMVAISAGLEVGDRIAANGAFKLREGLLVNAVPDTSGPETTLVE
jgi:membrane fusion protein (multidrug efflux system)